MPSDAVVKNPPANARHARDLSYLWVRKIPWSRKWQPTPVLLPGKFHGQRSLVSYNSWGCKESDMTDLMPVLKGKTDIQVLLKFMT